MNKKAYFFSVTVLIIVAGIYLTMVYSSSMNLERENVIQEERIKQLNSIITAFEKDTSDALKITSTRSLVALTEEVGDSSLLDNMQELEERFEELAVQGTFDGEKNGFMENSTLQNWTTAIENIFDGYNSEVNFDIGNVVIEQSTYSKVQVRVVLNYTIEDPRYGIKWDKKNREFTTSIDINGLKDPLYTHYTDGEYENIINITSAPSDGELELHVMNQYYIESSNAPSYLQRFINVNEGDFKLGIESLINTPLKEQAGFTIEDTSIIDWQYFITNPDTYCTDANLPSWIKINLTENYPIDC